MKKGKVTFFLTILTIIAIALIVFFLLSGKREPTGSTINEEEPTAKATFTLEEVSLHDNRDDCWMVIHDKVYDVTKFISSHPGGSAILQGCGINATTLFESRPQTGTPHSLAARNLLDNFFIGNLG